MAARPKRRREINRGDYWFRRLTQVFGALIVVILALVALSLVTGAEPSISSQGFGFVTGRDWDPVRGSYGALPLLFGTLVSSIVALLFAVPVSLGVALFLVEIAPRKVRAPIAFAIELLAAVPSVIYGLWGFFVLRPWMVSSVEPGLERSLGFLPLFRDRSQGNDILLASSVLALMVLPTISSVSREVLSSVPNSLREGALALGATRWEVIRTVVLPYARSGITGAVLLGLGRALGETMAVTMLIGNKHQIAASLFQPASTMASILANQYPEASGMQLAALTEVGLLLFMLTLLLNVLARVLVWRVARAGGVDE